MDVKMTPAAQAATLAFMGYTPDECTLALCEVNDQLDADSARRLTDAAFSRAKEDETA